MYGSRCVLHLTSPSPLIVASTGFRTRNRMRTSSRSPTRMPSLLFPGTTLAIWRRSSRGSAPSWPRPSNSAGAVALLRFLVVVCRCWLGSGFSSPVASNVRWQWASRLLLVFNTRIKIEQCFIVMAFVRSSLTSRLLQLRGHHHDQDGAARRRQKSGDALRSRKLLPSASKLLRLPLLRTPTCPRTHTFGRARATTLLTISATSGFQFYLENFDFYVVLIKNCWLDFSVYLASMYWQSNHVRMTVSVHRAHT